MSGGMISNLASKGIYKVGSALGNAWESTKNFASNVWDTGKLIGMLGIDAAKQLGGFAWEKTKNFLGISSKNSFGENAQNVMKRAFELNPVNLLSKGVGKLNDLAGDPLGKAREGIQEMATNLSQSIEDIKTKTADIWSKTKENVSKKWDETKTKFSETVENIKTKTANVWNSAKDTASKKWEETKTKLSGAVENIKTKTSSVWNSAKETASKK